MFDNFRRRKNIRIAQSREAGFQERLEAMHALGSRPAAPDAIQALAAVAESDDPLNVRQVAIGILASLSEPESLRSLLRLVTSNQPNHWVFIDSWSALRWKASTLNTFAGEALDSLRRLGRDSIRWNDNKLLGEVRSLIGELQTPGIHAALAEFETLLEDRRRQKLPALLKTALESMDFDEVESAIAEIAGLGTDEAQAALVEVRRQKVRDLNHRYEKDNEDVETGYSPKWVTVKIASSELGRTLQGPARARWNSAKG